ncbi:hypothetical protein D9619_000465 [Psilocybe cf. subviscida]|uniref:Uncharacterized protein n=1 Tax=Psilocybe cf. subviscida TaxID=2480587 RepID=A0A8H5BFM7_9AGAR|nr:hypothetical protein D9619_000465 [Psilocybe cf. subviscida]
MSYNNAPMIAKLGEGVEARPVYSRPKPRRRATSQPCLPERLPTMGFMEREAQTLAPQEFLKQQLQHSIEDALDTEFIVEPELIERTSSDDQRSRRSSAPESPKTASSIRSFMQTLVKPRTRTTSANWSNIQPYEIMRAIEEKDIMFLMEVRDKAFPLLLQNHGGKTPLVHAIRTGNKDVAIVLLGAFSRWVNYLEDSEFQKPQTRTYLKALRVGLKLAINEGLASSQIELIASFMQTLIMSEGDKWVVAQVYEISRALSMGSDGKPVATAGASVRRFATRELGKADLIASLEDYDLLMMGAWANVLNTISGDPLPSYYFARDDRVYKAFTDRLDTHKSQIQRSCGRRLRWQLQVLREVLDGRALTFRPLRLIKVPFWMKITPKFQAYIRAHIDHMLPFASSQSTAHPPPSTG